MAGKQNEKRGEKRKPAKSSEKRQGRPEEREMREKSAEPAKTAKSAKDSKPGKSGKPGKRSAAEGSGARPLRELLRVTPGERPDLGRRDPSATPGGPADKAAGVAATALLAQPLGSLQEQLYAASTAGDRRRVLLVLQGMDTSGKGGTLKHVIGLFNPSGCRIKAFKAPTEEELGHPFLWRIEQELPGRARSASSTAPTTRTCSSPGSASWCHVTGCAPGTPRSTGSRRPSRTTA